MSDYTKGEWHIIGKSEMDGIEIGIDNKDGTKCPLATVSWYGEDDCNAEQDEATARLITAAPNLLEACKEVQKVFGFIAENYKSAPHFPNAERLVDAAIAKCEA
jgi:hypothetical protein